MSVKKSKVKLVDSFFQMGQSEEKVFYSSEEGNTDLRFVGPNDNALLTLRIIQDATIEEYERRVYSIFDVTGKLGGVYEILFIIGAFLTSNFSSKIYLYSVFSRLYYTEQEDENERDHKVNENFNENFEKKNEDKLNKFKLKKVFKTSLTKKIPQNTNQV